MKSVPPSFGAAVATGETGVSRASKSVSDGVAPAVATTDVRLQTSRYPGAESRTRASPSIAGSAKRPETVTDARGSGSARAAPPAARSVAEPVPRGRDVASSNSSPTRTVALDRGAKSRTNGTSAFPATSRTPDERARLKARAPRSLPGAVTVRTSPSAEGAREAVITPPLPVVSSRRTVSPERRVAGSIASSKVIARSVAVRTTSTTCGGVQSVVNETVAGGETFPAASRATTDRVWCVSARSGTLDREPAVGTDDRLGDRGAARDDDRRTRLGAPRHVSRDGAEEGRHRVEDGRRGSGQIDRGEPHRDRHEPVPGAVGERRRERQLVEARVGERRNGSHRDDRPVRRDGDRARSLAIRPEDECGRHDGRGVELLAEREADLGREGDASLAVGWDGGDEARRDGVERDRRTRRPLLSRRLPGTGREGVEALDERDVDDEVVAAPGRDQAVDRDLLEVLERGEADDDVAAESSRKRAPSRGETILTTGAALSSVTATRTAAS